MIKKFLLTAITLVIAAAAVAQDSSSSSVVRRRGAADRGAKNATPGVTQRMQSHLASSGTDDSELQWMRVMYRELDLTKDENGALYYPDEPVEGQDNLFRIIMRHMADGSLGAYEYLDGREVFNDDFRVKMRDSTSSTATPRARPKRIPSLPSRRPTCPPRRYCRIT